MESGVFERIRAGLVDRRSNLASWLRSTPPAKRQIQLGPAGEHEVAQHLETLVSAAEQAAAGDLGICDVCHEHVDSALLEMDYTACVCLDHLSGDDRRMLESELELAQAVQRSLLPQEVPDTPALQIAAYSRPAQILGGDYFGFFTFESGAQGLAIADVAGHGISASLHMAGVHALLQTLTPTADSPGDVLKQVHRLFIHNATFSTFVTVFLAAYDRGAHTLTYANAGHNPPLLLRCAEDGRRVAEWLWPGAPAVGLVEDAEFPVTTCPVAPGDVLLLYTDGVTEATGAQGDEFGVERLAAAVERHAEASAREVLQAIRQDLERHVDGRPLVDDTTLVVCKIN